MEYIQADEDQIKLAENELLRTKIQVMSRSEWVFFSTIIMSLHHYISTEVPTAATDGKNVMYNPTFFLNLTLDERIGLLLHEVMHVVFQHMFRREDMDPSLFRKWNVAGDYVINLELVNSKAILPKGALLDIKYQGMSTEEVFSSLPDDDPGMNEEGFMEDVLAPDENATASEIADMKKSIDDILLQADHAARTSNQAGTIPASIQRYLKDLLNPVVPWQKVLKNFMTKAAKIDYTFRKPNKRFFPDHLLPSLSGEDVCDIAVAVDVSGSVGAHEFNVFLSEVQAIIKGMRPTKTTFIQFDTRISAENVLRTHQDLLNVKFVGGGGTLIDPVMDWAVKNRPHVLIVFTDGYYTPPSIKPKSPVLWVVHDNKRFKAPFGRHIPFAVPKGRQR